MQKLCYALYNKWIYIDSGASHFGGVTRHPLDNPSSEPRLSHMPMDLYKTIIMSQFYTSLSSVLCPKQNCFSSKVPKLMMFLTQLQKFFNSTSLNFLTSRSFPPCIKWWKDLYIADICTSFLSWLWSTKAKVCSLSFPHYIHTLYALC